MDALFGDLEANLTQAAKERLTSLYENECDIFKKILTLDMPQKREIYATAPNFSTTTSKPPLKGGTIEMLQQLNRIVLRATKLGFTRSGTRKALKPKELDQVCL